MSKPNAVLTITEHLEDSSEWEVRIETQDGLHSDETTINPTSDDAPCGADQLWGYDAGDEFLAEVEANPDDTLTIKKITAPYTY